MARTLRLLLIEDSEDDALLAVEELRKGGFEPNFTRVDTSKALEAALDEGGWDAVIADYNLPSFTGIDALRIVQAKGVDLPLLLVSGAIGEELAAEAMKAGFHDFIIKGHYSRLAQALERELREVVVRRERSLAVEGLRQAYAELEQRVSERTAELQVANKALSQSKEQLQSLNDELEQRVERRTRELQETQKQFLHAEKLSAIGQLSASIAHEFNNPLQGILSILKGLKKRAILEEEDKELLLAAISEGDRIKDLIRSLQDFNRPSSGRKTLMDVHHSLDSILLLNKSDFNGRRISVVRNYVENLPRIMVVSDQIKQVFLNLLTNAADACHQRSGVITVSTWQEKEKVAVAIKDNCDGIKPEDMERIFQPFFTTKAEVKGTGLGLSVSYGIIKKHQGDIRVESKLGEGATFTVLLPIKGADEASNYAIK